MNGLKLSVMPTCSAPPARSTSMPRPWASRRWWTAATAAARLGSPRRVNAGGVAEKGRAPRLVQRRPRRHPVAEGLVDRARVLREAIRGVAVGPTAGVLQGLRQVPVVQRHPGPDVVRQQFVDEARVEVESGRVDRATVRTDARPRHREAVGVESEIGHQARRLRASAGSGRTPAHRCRRRRSRPGRDRTCPRSNRCDRRPASPPRSGTTPSRFPTRSRRGTSMWRGRWWCSMRSPVQYGARRRVTSRSPHVPSRPRWASPGTPASASSTPRSTCSARAGSMRCRSTRSPARSASASRPSCTGSRRRMISSTRCSRRQPPNWPS